MQMNLLFIGIMSSLLGAAFLALSMVIQRYALSYPEDRVPLLCCELHRYVAWFLGLVTYGFACTLQVVALLFGPLILMGSVFTTLLIWNIIFAKFLLGEPVTVPKFAGSLVILVGVCFVVVGTPSGIQVDFTPDDIVELLSRPIGAFYVASLFVTLLACIVVITIYERTYPAKRLQKSEAMNWGSPKLEVMEGKKSKTAFQKAPTLTKNELNVENLDDIKSNIDTTKTSSDSPSSSAAHALSSPQSVDVEKQEVASNNEKTTTTEKEKKEKQELVIETGDDDAADTEPPPRNPPPMIDSMMSFIYPFSLGLDESIASLTMKATFSMLANCSGNECNHWVLYASGIIWVTCSLATVVWLKIVFGRYETTKALPVEYGTLNAFSMLTGLIFYREYRYLAPGQFGFVLSGLLVILTGLAVGRVDEKWCNDCLGIRGASDSDDEDVVNVRSARQYSVKNANGSERHMKVQDIEMKNIETKNVEIK